MKTKYLLYLAIFFTFLFFIGFKPSKAFAQSCWVDHNLCYAAVGCTVGQPCSAPVCQFDGGDYGHISGPYHCDFCPGTGNNCVWYDVHFCGVPGCPDCSECSHDGGVGSSDFNGTIIAEDTGSQRYISPQVIVHSSSGNVAWRSDSLGGHFDILDASAGTVDVTLTPVSGYDSCSWYIWNYDTSSSTGEAGNSCTASFDLPSGDWHRAVSFTMRKLPPAITCGIMTDPQASFETGESYSTWRPSGTATLSKARSTFQHSNGIASLQANYSGKSDTPYMWLGTTVSQVPGSTQQFDFTGWYYLNSKTNNDGRMTLCLEYWNGGTWLASYCGSWVNFSGTLGSWREFPNIIGPYVAGATFTKADVIIQGVNDVEFYIDKMCLEVEPIPTPTPIPTPIPASINFYLHEVDNTDACTNSTSSYSNPADSAVTINESGSGVVTSFPVGSGLVSYSPSATTHNYSINPPSDWACACSISGATRDNSCGLSAYNQNIQWSITQVASSWWQTKGGNVHSQASINVDIPPGLTQQLSLTDNGAVGVITSGEIIGNDLTDTWRYPNTPFNFTDNPIDYQFFWLQAGGPNVANIPSTISAGDLDTDGVYYSNTNVTLDNTEWNNFNYQAVVFVKGNLTIPENQTINLENDKFLAFVVSGDINISTGHLVPNNSEIDLQAVFIANGNINIIGEEDLQFVGQGVFAAGVDGSGNVTFNRDLGIDNNLYPPVLFIWDPELILNAPQILMQNSTNWHEVPPRGN